MAKKQNAQKMTCSTGKVTDDDIIRHAKDILLKRLTKRKISCSVSVAEYLQLEFAEERNEIFGLIGLNSRHYIIDVIRISEGSSTETPTPIRNIVYEVLKLNAVAVIIFHNHVSGYVSPSPQDEEMTQKLKAAFQAVDITLLDHVIVGKQGFYSFGDNELL